MISFLNLSKKISKGSFFLVFAIVTNTCLAYVAGSSNYRIQTDSVNISGGVSGSTNYNVNNTTGENATGESTSSSYKVKAGYQQIQSTSISISSPADVTLGALSFNQPSAVGNVTWNVVTDNPAGYTFTIASSPDASCVDNDGQGIPDTLCNLDATNTFDDLATTSKSTWSVSNSYSFGWSAFGSNTTGHGSGSSCENTSNIPSATLLWQGFDGENTSYEIASSTSETSGSGVDTTLCFATEQDTVFAPAGSYFATTTATVVAY